MWLLIRVVMLGGRAHKVIFHGLAMGDEVEGGGGCVERGGKQSRMEPLTTVATGGD